MFSEWGIRSGHLPVQTTTGKPKVRFNPVEPSSLKDQAIRGVISSNIPFRKSIWSHFVGQKLSAFDGWHL
jgi:hypothetical protein